MSERSVRQNARRRGKCDFWKGVPLSDNPMRCASSRMAWKEGWESEQAIRRLDDSIRSEREEVDDG